jgi:hypothetical protein
MGGIGRTEDRRHALFKAAPIDDLQIEESWPHRQLDFRIIQTLGLMGAATVLAPKVDEHRVAQLEPFVTAGPRMTNANGCGFRADARHEVLIVCLDDDRPTGACQAVGDPAKSC